MRSAWLLCCAIGLSPVAAADPLTFADAIARAGADAPSVAARRAGLEAARLSIKSAGQLPDPQLALGVQNLPITGVDPFELNRDFMTMKGVGVMQDMPSREKRQARTGMAEAEAGTARALLDLSRLEARLEAARAWVDVFYGLAERGVLEDLSRELQALADASTASLSAGSGSADAALYARIEASKIDDRVSDLEARLATARAELERWIGPIGPDDPGPTAPTFDIQPELLRQHVEHHVAVAAALAETTRARAGVDLARADRKSDWSWELMYQSREPAFTDMISVGVRFSLPLFQSSRQSPRIESRRADVGRAEAEREAVLRQHRAHLDAMLAEHAATAERLQRIVEVQLPLTRQRQAVAEAGLAAGNLSITEFISARTAVLEMDLARLGLERRLTALGAMLTLEHGEVVP